MSTHNIGFYEDLTKIIFQLSSNTHLISSSAININFCSPLPRRLYMKFGFVWLAKQFWRSLKMDDG